MRHVVFLALLTVLVLGPLAVAAWRDRHEAAAFALQAGIGRVIDQVLGGDSLLSVEVVPSAPWRAGRVVLSTPTDAERLLETAWTSLITRVPPGYGIVFVWLG